MSQREVRRQLYEKKMRESGLQIVETEDVGKIHCEVYRALSKAGLVLISVLAARDEDAEKQIEGELKKAGREAFYIEWVKSGRRLQLVKENNGSGIPLTADLMKAKLDSFVEEFTGKMVEAVVSFKTQEELEEFFREVLAKALDRRAPAVEKAHRAVQGGVKKGSTAGSGSLRGLHPGDQVKVNQKSWEGFNGGRMQFVGPSVEKEGWAVVGCQRPRSGWKEWTVKAEFLEKIGK